MLFSFRLTSLPNGYPPSDFYHFLKTGCKVRSTEYLAPTFSKDFLTTLGLFCWTKFGDGGDVVCPKAPSRFSLKEWALEANLPFIIPDLTGCGNS